MERELVTDPSPAEEVRCPRCGTLYSLSPAEAACPECGYLTWLAVAIPPEIPSASAPLRS